MFWPRMNSLLTAQFLPIPRALPTYSSSGTISGSRTSAPAHGSKFALVGGQMVQSILPVPGKQIGNLSASTNFGGNAVTQDLCLKQSLFVATEV